MQGLIIYVKGQPRDVGAIERIMNAVKDGGTGASEDLEVIIEKIGGGSDVYKDSVLTVAYRFRKVQVRGEDIALANLEFQLLEALTSQPNVPLSNEAIAGILWGSYDKARRKEINVYIRSLRVKLEEYPESPTLIVTWKNAGYAYMSPDSPSQH